MATADIPCVPKRNYTSGLNVRRVHAAADPAGELDELILLYPSGNLPFKGAVLTLPQTDRLIEILQCYRAELDRPASNVAPAHSRCDSNTAMPAAPQTAEPLTVDEFFSGHPDAIIPEANSPLIGVGRRMKIAESPNRLALLIRGMRAKKGMTRKQLASECGLSRETLRKIEAGGTPGYRSSWQLLAAFTGFSVDKLELLARCPWPPKKEHAA